MNNKKKGEISFSRYKSQIPTPRNSDHKTSKKTRRTSKLNRNTIDVIGKNTSFVASKKETKIHSFIKESPKYTQVKKKTLEEQMNDKIDTMQMDIGEMKENIGEMKANIGEMKENIGEMKENIIQIKQDIGVTKTEIVGAINNLGVTIQIEIRGLANLIKQFLGITQTDNERLNKEKDDKIKTNANDPNKANIQENYSNKLEIKFNNKNQKKEDSKIKNFQYAQVINLNRHLGNGGVNSNSLGFSRETFDIEIADSLDETKKDNKRNIIKKSDKNSANNGKLSDTSSSNNEKNGQITESQYASLSQGNNSKESVYSDSFSKMKKRNETVDMKLAKFD